MTSSLQALGKTGVVQSVIGGEKAKVEIRSRSYIWNTKCLILIAKGGNEKREIMRTISMFPKQVSLKYHRVCFRGNDESHFEEKHSLKQIHENQEDKLI